MNLYWTQKSHSKHRHEVPLAVAGKHKHVNSKIDEAQTSSNKEVCFYKCVHSNGFYFIRVTICFIGDSELESCDSRQTLEALRKNRYLVGVGSKR